MSNTLSFARNASIKNLTLNPSLTLASASPRRQAMAKTWGIPFDCYAPNIHEVNYEHEKPIDFVKRMAMEKAISSAQQYTQTVTDGQMVEATSEIASESTSESTNEAINPFTHDTDRPPHSHYWLSADTIVVLDDQILGKPIDQAHAKSMLSSLSGRTHHVMSAWAIADQNEIVKQGIDCTAVTFHTLSEETIDQYLSYAQFMDKAGSYAIQGEAGHFVAQIEGSFNTVVGMPLYRITQALIDLMVIDLPHPHILLQSIAIQERIKTATWRSGRDLDAVHLIAVSKRNSVDKIQAAQRHQIIHFGESYVQEWLSKHQALSAMETNTNTKSTQEKVIWHFIGKIQTNKAKYLAPHVTWVHGLSRWSEAEALSRACEKAIQEGVRNQAIQVLIQVNLAAEQSKNGISLEALPDLVKQCQSLSGIVVRGLMTFPPLDTAEKSRKYFQQLKSIQQQLQHEYPHITHLSMGTSHDFEVAIEEGATWVRIGQSLFTPQTDLV